MNHVRAFVAGFLSTLVFHQGVILVFHLLGAFPRAPWNFTPVPPLGIPSVISLSFWAGLWGIALWPLLKNVSGSAYWIRAIVLGALGPTLVAFLVVVPLKGGTVGAGWDPKLWIGGFIVNAAWGYGLALFLRGFRKVGF